MDGVFDDVLFALPDQAIDPAGEVHLAAVYTAGRPVNSFHELLYAHTLLYGAKQKGKAEALPHC